MENQWGLALIFCLISISQPISLPLKGFTSLRVAPTPRFSSSDLFRRAHLRIYAQPRGNRKQKLRLEDAGEEFWRSRQIRKGDVNGQNKARDETPKNRFGSYQEKDDDIWGQRQGYGITGPKRDAVMLKTMIEDFKAATESIELQTLQRITHMSGEDTVNTLWAFAKVQQAPAPRVLKSLEERLGDHVSRLGGQALATAMWAFATIGVRPNGRLINAIQTRTSRNIRDCTAQNAISILWALVRLNITPTRELMEAIDKRIYFILKNETALGSYMNPKRPESITASNQGLSPRACANLLWAWARLAHQPPRHERRVVEDHVVASLRQFQPKHMANIMWAFARSDWIPRREVLRAIENRMIQIIGEFETQGLVNVLWAHSRLMITPSHMLLRKINANLLRTMSRCNAQDVANALYSYAKLSMPPPRPLLGALKAQMLTCRQQLNAQMLSNIMWAFAKLEYNLNREDMVTVLRQVENRIQTFNAQGVGTIMWALGTLSIQPSPVLLAKITNRMEKTMKDFTPQCTANTYWAFARLLLEPTPSLARALSNRTLYTVNDFKPQNIANTLWAFARIGKAIPSNLGRALERRLELAVDSAPDWMTTDKGNSKKPNVRQRHLASQTPSSIEGAITRNGSGYYKRKHSLVELKRKRKPLDNDFNSQDLANSLWALAVLDLTKSSLFIRLWELGQRFCQWNSRELVQVYEVYAYVAGPKITNGGTGLVSGKAFQESPPEFQLRWRQDKIRRRAREECAKLQAKEKQTTSRFHRSIAATLKRLGIECQNEVRVGTFAVDIHVTEPGLDHILIEADGPSHFLHNSTSRNGPATLKKKALTNLGWKVISIPHFDWGTLETEKDQEIYLAEQLSISSFE
mmetsp:Transcript_6706/g.10258  ORF Transcript_6706/g.10258 Transcript_6706/m.10258 type:complete len:865 (+) Transcript_6706:58-2652(+)